jgi:L-fuculose-phosphate aldolase
MPARGNQEAAREAVADACRRLAGEGLVHATAGNVSARVDDHVVVTPTGAVLAELRPELTTVVDMAGSLVEGDLEPTSELFLHLAIYERFDAGAVVHTHSPVATALSCVVEEVPPVHYQMLAFGGAVRVAPYATFGTRELANNVHAALEGRSAALMQNHGAVCFAGDCHAATELALLLEWACEVYWRASAIGDPRVLSEDELAGVVQAVSERGYGQSSAGEGEAARAGP